MATNFHPIFDAASEFRQLKLDSVAADGGQSTVRQYFESLRRRHLREAWLDVDMPNAQEWGFGTEVDRAIHEHLTESREQAQLTRVAPVLAHAAGGAITPALLIYDLDADPIRALRSEPLRNPGVLFSGIGQSRGEISQFAMSVGGLPENRECFAIILTPSTLHRLGALVAPKTDAERKAVTAYLSGEGKCPARVPNDDADAVNTINHCLAAQTLQPTGSDRIPHLRADAVNLLLSLVPLFTGSTRTTAGGEFHVKIPLDRQSPIPEPGTFVLLCLGPNRSTTSTSGEHHA